MEEIRNFVAYVEWGIVIGLTILFFAYFSRIHQKFGRLLTFVLIPTWLILTIVKGVENLYFDKVNGFTSFYGFSMLMAESLPLVLIFGGITFGVKFNRFRKRIKA
jgi:hypothetical protein